MSTGIGVDFEANAPAPPPMTPAAAVNALLAGQADGHYPLPPAVLAADAGYRGLVAAEQANHALRIDKYPAGWEGAEVGRLVALYLAESTSTGALPKVAIGAHLAEMRAESSRLVDDADVISKAAEKAEGYAANAARWRSGEIHKNLTTALAELLTKARPHSKAIAAVKSEVAAVRVDRASFDVLEALAPRLLALEAAGAALAALGAPWPALADLPAGGPDVLRLARLAAG